MSNFLAVTNIADIAVAAVAAIPAVVTVLVSNRQQNKKLDRANTQLATSNGKTSGQYIEELYHQFTSVKAGQEVMVRQMAEHTAQDATNFASIEARLNQIADTVDALEGDES